VAALVDLDRLGGWMDEQGLPRGTVESPTLLQGGTQNILLRFTRGGAEYVLRRPPRHPRMDGNTIMRRESRVLAALASTDVPHPRLIAACDTPEVLGAAFYLMQSVSGFNATVGLPALHAGDADIRHRMGLALADGAAALARVDLVAVGLGDLGKLDGFLERQVGRWRAQLEGYREYEGWPGPGAIPGVQEVGDWLDAHRPPSFTPGIVHGDYHLANVMFRSDGPELAAIVDWELATIGDPLVDLGWMLATWPDAAGVSPVGLTASPWAGFPGAQALVARYAQGSARELTHLRWYAVLACYKLGILQEGTHARAFAGKAPRATGERLHAATISLFERALRWLEPNGFDASNDRAFP
jgi:aminoglycoside phosphotransferase (APT) family kinase protein